MAATRWHVLGAGALGTLWSARLCRAADMNLASRPTLVLRDEAFDSFRLTSKSESNVGPAEKSTARCRLHVAEVYNGPGKHRRWFVEVEAQPVSAIDPIHHLLVTTKAPDVHRAVRGVAQRLHPKAIVVILCNGMGAYEELMSDQLVGGAAYMLASTTNGAFMTGRFECVHAGLGETWIGRPSGSRLSHDDAQATAKSLQHAGLNVKLDNTIERTLWKKLAANASINGLTAIMDCRNGVILESANGISLVKRICEEVANVMQAGGTMPPSDLLGSVTRVMTQNSMNFSSMRQDMVSGRACEIDYINGFVVRRGDLLGVPTLTNRAIYDLVKMKESLRE